MHTDTATAQNTRAKREPADNLARPFAPEVYLLKNNDTKTPYRASLRILFFNKRSPATDLVFAPTLAHCGLARFLRTPPSRLRGGIAAK
jgi:hypothetical protein